jgi:LPXTG-motif cell wall-anchored protein
VIGTEQLVKRIALVGALVAVLGLWALPAMAQEGSVLPTPTEGTGVLPDAPVATPASSEDTGVLPETTDDDDDDVDDDQAVAAADDDLANTGFDLTTGLLAGAGLLAVGGTALVLARRRGADA